MAPHHKGCTLPIAMAAALFLAAGQALAWDGISGNWCSENDGCGKWHSLYKVEVKVIQSRARKELEQLRKSWTTVLEIEQILKKMGMFPSQEELVNSQKELLTSQLAHLRSRRDELQPEIAVEIWYRDIKLEKQPDLLRIIRGKIEPDQKWTIENGTIEERDGAVYRITAAVAKGGAGRTAGRAEPEIEGTITGTFKLKPDVVWEGAARFKATTATGIVRQLVESGREGPIPQDSIEIEATIDGGKHPVKGVLKGTLKKREDGWRMRGVYTPPPGDDCSYAGAHRAARRNWRTMEEGRLREHEKNASKFEASLRGGLISKEQKEERDIRVDAQWIKDGNKPPAEASESPTVASARKVPARAPDERLGKFQRRIEGTINAKKDTIAIKLPPLPVLNYRCGVDDIASDKELILVRQGSIQRIELSGSGGDRPEGGRGASDKGRP